MQRRHSQNKSSGAFTFMPVFPAPGRGETQEFQNSKAKISGNTAAIVVARM